MKKNEWKALLTKPLNCVKEAISVRFLRLMVIEEPIGAGFDRASR